MQTPARAALPYRMIVAAVDDEAIRPAIRSAVPPSPDVEPVARLAQRFATLLGAELVLFHADLGVDDVSAEVRSALDAQAAALQAKPLLAPLSEVPGRPGRVLAAHLDALEADLPEGARALAVLGSHGRRPLGAALLGSTTADFVMSSGRPALVAGPELQADVAIPARVVCCLDGSPRSETMVAEAAAWSAALGVGLWLVRAAEAVPALRADTRAADAYLDERVTSLAEQGITARRELVVARHPAVGLVSWLNERPGTLAVIATHGHTGLASVALGGTAGAVVRAARGPVLLRRPLDLLT